tara:strand:+ start:226 stop:405 length:180 start_codon:yes stop_codon:yes gene_type:complete
LVANTIEPIDERNAGSHPSKQITKRRFLSTINRGSEIKKVKDADLFDEDRWMMKAGVRT